MSRHRRDAIRRRDHLEVPHARIHCRVQHALVTRDACDDQALCPQMVEQYLQGCRKECRVLWLEDEVVVGTRLELPRDVCAQTLRAQRFADDKLEVRAPLAAIVVRINDGHMRCMAALPQARQARRNPRRLPFQLAAIGKLPAANHVQDDKRGVMSSIAPDQASPLRAMAWRGGCLHGSGVQWSDHG